MSTDSTTPPDSISPKENWPNYATFVKALAPIDRNLQWLADFISQDAGPTSEGSLHVLEYDEDGIKDQAYSFDKLHSPPAAGSTRIVLLSHSNTWNLDRELLDRVAFDVFYRIFGNMLIETIRAATRNHPTNFLCPLFSGFCNYMTLWMQEGDGILFHDAASYEAAQLNEVVKRIEYGVILCGQTINRMDKYLNAHPEARTPAMPAALENLRMVQGMSKDQLNRCQMLTSRLVSIMSLEESRRSIEQSVSTRRLTRRAYVFLPLSLSTSAFGMNVAPIQNVQIWVFFITSFALLLASLSVWYWLDWLSNQAYWLFHWAYRLFYRTKVFCQTYNARRRARSKSGYNSTVSSPVKWFKL
ncbi:MAG: hypothetical protein Q9194_003626 [Teloschistes cf. exilis]